MIQLKNVDKVYKSYAGKVEALKSVNLKINKGESIAIVGKSGSGKSTLLNIISGIDRIDSGDIVINDTQINKFNENQLALWRGKNIGIVFQFYQLLPILTAEDNVLFAMDIVSIIPKGERKQRAFDLLKEVGLERKMKKFPSELSGGEIQRVAIARALANDPPILVADEPTGNLDSKTGDQVYQVFDKFSKEGKTLIIVTHENISNRQFDRVIHIHDGSIAD